MANKITWADKVALQEKPDVAAVNKVTAADMNQIKTAVNETIDTMPSNLVNGQKTKGGIRSIGAYDETEKLLGEYAQAFGYRTRASGNCAHAEGYYTAVLANYSHAEGNETTASGFISHAEGNLTKASGECSHAEGNDTTAKGKYSHSEGCFTRAYGLSAHAEGENARASGDYSHAEGDRTDALGERSHAEGYSTIAQGDNQHVQGKWNIADTTSAYIVGNGAEGTDANSDANRSNAHTIDWSGNAWFAGDIYTGSTSGTNKDDGSIKLPVVYSGTAAPSDDIGKNGDLYVLLDS